MRLGELMDEVARATSLEQVYAGALACIADALDVERASVLLFDDQGVMRFVAWRGLSDTYREAVEGHTPWSPDAWDAWPILVPDVMQDAELSAYGDVFRREDIAALAFVPLRFGKRLLGKFMLYHRTRHQFTDEEVAVARAIAGHVAFAVAHFRAEAALRSAHVSLEERLQVEHHARRRAEREMAMRHAVEESILAGIAATDHEGVQIYANAALCNMLGWSQEELVGARPPFVYWPPEELDRIQQALELTLRGEAPPEGFELRFCRRNGERIDVLLLISPLRDGSGAPARGWLSSVHDITDRKRAEARVRASEERLRLALAAGHMGTWAWDLDTGRVTWSSEVEALHGLPPGSFEGTFEAFEKDIHPEDRARVREAVRRSVDEGKDYLVDYRIVLPGGGVRWVDARGQVVGSRDGGGRRMLGVCSDATQSKRREEVQEFLADAAGVLSSSLDPEEALRALARFAVPRLGDFCAVHLLGDGGELQLVEVAHADPERRALVLELQRRWPLPADAPVGAPMAVRTGKSSLQERLTRERLERAAQSPEHLRVLEELGLWSTLVVPLRARGRTLGAITLVCAESRRTYGPEDLQLAEELASRTALWVDNARAYREAERARELAEEAARRVQTLAEASRLVAESLDREGALQKLAHYAVATMADYCISYALEADGSIRRVGLAHRDPQKQAVLEELVGAGDPRLDDAYGAGAVLRTGESVLAPEVSDELLGTTAQNGKHLSTLRKLKPRSSIIVPLRARNRTLGAIAFATTDDSGRRYTEEDLALAEDLASRAALLVDNARLYGEAQQAVQARDEMVGVVSHDLRNPLGTILTSCSILKLDPPADRRNRAHETIRRAARQMERLIEDLLDVTRIEAGRLPLELEAVDVAAVTSEVVALMQPLAQDRQIRLGVTTGADLPPVHADRVRLIQVLSNLVGNAIKFGPDGGRVDVRTESHGHQVRVAVTDDGPGISPEHLPQVFDRFFQGDGKDRAGSGLGLAISKGIVEAHGGTLAVESTPGRGSTFWFALPREQAVPVASAASEARPLTRR